MKRNLFSLFSILFLVSFVSFGNNLQVSNVQRPADNQIRFDISWANSWYITNGPANWDAAWVFVKFQDCDPDLKPWKHVLLSSTSADHSVGSPLRVDAVDDGVGVFVRRANPGQGNIPLTTVTLQLASAYDLATTNFEVMAIEMVFVPQGDFFVGGISGTPNTSGSTLRYSLKNGYEITSENAIAAGALNTGNETDPSPVVATTQVGYVPAIPAAFPKGYNSFYMMKYEITQEQWVRFLNLLTPDQQSTLTGVNLYSATGTAVYGTGARNGIKIEVPQPNANTGALFMNNLTNDAYFNYVDDGQSIAKAYTSWRDLLAYLDWSGLRPMTELEYEKACRGPEPMVINEYAWGTANIGMAYSANRTNANYANEGTSLVPAFPVGVASYGNTSYLPYRVGFAATATSNRLQAGASYWGIMELSGNVYEQTVSVGYANGNIANFTGTLGDGELDANGDADQAGWDLDPVKSIVRGGSYGSTAAFLRVADRQNINNTSFNATRHQETGGRGVRQFNP